MLLDNERYAPAIAYGREAMNKLKEDKLEEGFAIAELGWEAFPESGAKWNQGYNYAKTFFGRALKNNNMPIAKRWLDRMIENNNELHLVDFELEHLKAKYAFEVGDLDEAFLLWKNLVKQRGVGYRFFAEDDPKYKEFYKSRK